MIFSKYKIFNLKVCWIKPFISGFGPNPIEHRAKTGRLHWEYTVSTLTVHCLLQPYSCGPRLLGAPQLLIWHWVSNRLPHLAMLSGVANVLMRALTAQARSPRVPGVSGPARTCLHFPGPGGRAWPLERVFSQFHPLPFLQTPGQNLGWYLLCTKYTDNYSTVFTTYSLQA